MKVTSLCLGADLFPFWRCEENASANSKVARHVLLAPGPRSTSLGRSVPPKRPPLDAFGCPRHFSGMQKRSLLRQLMSRQETTTVSSRDNLSCGWQELYTYLSILVCRSALIYTPIYIFIHTEFFSLRGTMRTSVALVLCLCVSACV